ncbi:hypothetical protein ACFX14_030662 [Malus domestica]
MIEGCLRFPRSSVFDYVGNVSKSLRPSSVNFELNGFWSESSGNICMVGSGSNYLGHGRGLYYPAVLKLYNVMNSTSVTSLIIETLESSMSSESNPKHCLSAKICTPFADSDLPRIVSLKAIECSENTQRIRVQVEFGDISNPWYQRPFNRNTVEYQSMQ